MSITSSNGYDIEVNIPNIKLSDINKYSILSDESATEYKFDIHRVELDELSFEKSDSELEYNRLISNYTGTLFSGDITYKNSRNEDITYSVDFNKLLPSDLELFSTNTSTSPNDNIQSIDDYSNYLRAVYINDGINDILKIQLNGTKREKIVKLYKDDNLVITIKYNNNVGRSHLITISSQLSEDSLSNKLHEAEDAYVESIKNQEGYSDSIHFSNGKGILHNKVSDCNISYLICDTSKNVISESNILNTNSFRVINDRNINNSVITRDNKKIFRGVPSMG